MLSAHGFQIRNTTGISFLARSLNDEESLKIIRSESGSSPKLNQFVLVTHPTCPPNFIQIHPQLFEISCYKQFLALSLNAEESLKKILVVESGSRSSPKSNQFVLVTHQTCPPNFIQIHPQLFEISCTQTDRQKGGENNLLHLRWWR